MNLTSSFSHPEISEMLRFSSDRDLLAFSRANRECSEIIKADSEVLFSPKFLEISKLKATHLTDLEAKEKAYSTHVSAARFSRVICYINNPKSCILFTICKVFQFIFPCIKREVIKQNLLRSEIALVKSKISIAAEHVASIDFKRLESRYLIVSALFGDSRTFEALPVLDIGNRRGFTDYIDFIRAEELTAPIMRGTDLFGRRFFTFKIKKESSEDPFCRTFFERYTADHLTWTQGGNGDVIPLPYGLVNSLGKICDPAAFAKLKALIHTRKTTTAGITYNLVESPKAENVQKLDHERQPLDLDDAAILPLN